MGGEGEARIKKDTQERSLFGGVRQATRGVIIGVLTVSERAGEHLLSKHPAKIPRIYFAHFIDLRGKIGMYRPLRFRRHPQRDEFVLVLVCV